MTPAQRIVVLRAPVGGAVSNVEFDPATTPGAVTLSAGNKTATKSANDGAHSMVRGIPSVVGVQTVNVLINARANSNNPHIGVCNPAALNTNYVGQTADSIGLGALGGVDYNGAPVGAELISWAPASLVTMEIDAPGSRFRLKTAVDPFTSWIAIPFAGPFSAAVSLFNIGDSVTL